jgi:2-dehydro-3-deoxygluconokinase
VTRPRLVTAGEAMVRLSPPPGQVIRNASAFEAYVGGTELNAAIAAAQFGVDATWVSALPASPLAGRIVDHARRFGVEPVICDSPGRVGIYWVEVGPAPRGSEVYYDRDGSAFCVSATEQAVAEQLAKPVDATLATGISLALGTLPQAAVGELLDPRSGATRFFEINHRSKLWSRDEARLALESRLLEVDVLIASRSDLDALLGLGDDAVAAAKRARQHWGLDRVVITARSGDVGERGSNETIVVGDDVEAEASAEGLVVDPVGAGDTATGAFIATWLLTGSVERAAEASVTAAARKQTTRGDSAVLDSNWSVPDGPRIRR